MGFGAWAFYRGRNRGGNSSSTESHLSGTGFGLPIARKVIRAMSGEIIVKSEPGREALSRISLPAAGAS
jgi:signal transduction histidine kinase